MAQQYRVVVEGPIGDSVRVVGRPPYTQESTAGRVRTLWENLLIRRGVRNPKVKVQVTDVEWSDL